MPQIKYVQKNMGLLKIKTKITGPNAQTTIPVIKQKKANIAYKL